MVITYVLIALICLYKIRLSFFEKPKLVIYDDYISLEKSTSIKGIFILVVLFSHIYPQLNLPDSIFNTLFTKLNFDIISQGMVGLFMLYSGYGIMLSAMKKGRGYVKLMPKNRFLKTLLHFDIAVLLYLILQTVLGNSYSVGTILLSLLGWESLGNSNWYIFAILVLYLISYAALMLCREKYKQGGG